MSDATTTAGSSASVATKEATRRVKRLIHEIDSSLRTAPIPVPEDVYNSDEDSVHQNHGTWQDDTEDVPWNGCVCGVIHERPTKVFWMQCEGPCQAWFNVNSKCVGGLTAETVEHTEWYCPSCQTLMKKQSAFCGVLLESPPEVIYNILEFVANPSYRAGVLLHQVAPLNKTAHHFVQGDKSRGLWETILHKEYQLKKSPPPTTHKATTVARADPLPTANPPTRRSSKRRRKQTDFLSPCPSTTNNNHPRHAVQQQHLALLQRTEDAYYIIEGLADPFNTFRREEGAIGVKKHTTTLSLQKLRQVLQQHQPIDVNRPSPFTGRTLLHIVCAGEMVENVICSCVQHLLQDYRADPNIFSKQEQPFPNRPTLFFAIARAMPHLVQVLIHAGASLTTTVEGQFKLTFDSSQTMKGTFTPLEYAQTMKRVELVQCHVPPYWASRLNTMIQYLEIATSEHQKRMEEMAQTKKLEATGRARRAARRQKSSVIF